MLTGHRGKIKPAPSLAHQFMPQNSVAAFKLDSPDLTILNGGLNHRESYFVGLH